MARYFLLYGDDNGLVVHCNSVQASNAESAADYFCSGMYGQYRKMGMTYTILNAETGMRKFVVYRETPTPITWDWV
jgi:hypothetical protein